MKGYFIKEKNRYARRMKDVLIPIIEEMYDLHEGEEGKVLIISAMLDVFVSFLFVSLPDELTPEEKIEHVMSVLEHFVTLEAQNEIINNS